MTTPGGAPGACPERERCKAVFTAMTTMAGVWKALYCEGRFDTCARYRRAQAREPVPPHLLPNGHGAAALPPSTSPAAAKRG